MKKLKKNKFNWVDFLIYLNAKIFTKYNYYYIRYLETIENKKDNKNKKQKKSLKKIIMKMIDKLQQNIVMIILQSRKKKKIITMEIITIQKK